MLSKLDFLPGIVKSDTEYSQEGRYIDGDHVRWVKARPEKIGGWMSMASSLLTGVCRGLFPWRDNDSVRRIACGTNKKLTLFSGGTLADITPLRASGTLATDPFTTSNGSNVVIVTHVAHGANAGDYVTFSGAATFNGVTISGEYQIDSVIDADLYRIQHGTTATGSGSGGGASVTYEYQINNGLQDSTEAAGYGAGTYGTGTYGTPRPSTLTLFCRTWSLDNYGENLLACPRGGNLYQWDPDTGGRAQLVAGAPTNNMGMFVTEERFPVLYGADGNPMKVKWPNQDDITDWVPTETNTADERVLQDGNLIQTGFRVRSGVNLLLTDTAAVAMQYTGDDFVYRLFPVGRQCGVIGPHGADVYNGVAYWMGDTQFFKWSGGVVVPIDSKDIRDYVFKDVNLAQRAKFMCRVNRRFNEIWFFYCSANSVEIDRYVALMLDEGEKWHIGTLVRTAWVDSPLFTRPVATDLGGQLYEHENGTDDDGDALRAYLRSAPVDIDDGEQNFDIFAVIPDFKDQVGRLSLYLFTREYPRASEETAGPFTVLPSTDIIDDVGASGRQAAIQIESNEVGGHFRLGAIRVDIEPAGNR
jgi:hypothetical protein